MTSYGCQLMLTDKDAPSAVAFHSVYLPALLLARLVWVNFGEL